MKKAICMVLTLTVLLTCCTIGVSAKGKIADSLEGIMGKTADDEPIRVIIWLNDPVDKSEVFRQAIKECGYVGGLPLNMTMEEVDAYHMVYNRIVYEQETAAVSRFIENFGLDEACINETYCLCINANLTKAQIEAAAACDEVEGVYYDSEGLPVEPLDEITHTRQLFGQLCTSVAVDAEVMEYRELYCHADENGETDWVLVFGFSNAEVPMEFTTVIGNRVFTEIDYMIPFDTGYGIYDVKNDKFVDANSVEARSYEGFERIFDECGGGRLLGDLDGDNALSIVDVTLMQRCLAMMRDYPADDEFRITADYGTTAHYYSDFDRNGERDITDATKLQRYLIGIG